MAAVELRGVEKRFAGGTHAVRELSLAIDEGELLVCVGPSGSGKSTLLRLLAGLEGVDGGEILFDGERVNHRSPQERNVAMVFQSYALYPHMTVAANLAFPLRTRGIRRRARAARVAEVAALLGLTEFLDRRPAELSGGQRQRVAMGRALVRAPALLLLDEPLSNLDAQLRAQIRTEIAALVRRLATTTVYVTHDQVEAMTLGDRVAVLRDGALQQVGRPAELYARPANTFVAAFLGSPGMNLFRSRLHGGAGGGVWFELGRERLPVDPQCVHRLPGLEGHLEAPLIAGLRPEALLAADRVPADRRIDVRVEAVEPLGHETLVYWTAPPELVDGGGGPGGRLAARLPGDLQVVAGQAFTLGVDTRRLAFFDADGRAIP